MAHFVLDVNETLSDLTPVATVLEGHGAPAGLAATWFAGVLRDGFALSLQDRAPAFLDLARQELEVCLAGVEGLDASVADVVDEVAATLGSLGVHPDVVPGIAAMAEAGDVITAFTNGAAASARGLLERAGVLDRVAHVLSVEAGSVWKPHPGAYAAAVATLGAAPADLTMVAVHPWDLDGAGRAGLRTAWIDRAGGSPWPAVFRRPDLVVRTLGELAGG